MKLSKCVCGCKHISKYRDNKKVYYECPKCGIRTKNCESSREAGIDWNETIKAAELLKSKNLLSAE